MSHDSWLILPLILIHNSWIILLNHHLYSTSLKALSKKPWIMHDSWILNHPTSNPAEDAHTISLVNPWKFHSDWSSHVRAYREERAGFALSPHTPLYTYASCAGWINFGQMRQLGWCCVMHSTYHLRYITSLHMFWTRPRIFGVSDSQLKGILPTLLFGKRPTKTGSSCPIDSLLSGSGEVRRV